MSATMDLTTLGGTKQTDGVITGGATTERSTYLPTPQFTASYSAGYRLSDGANSATFGQAQLTFDTTHPNGNGTVLFTNLSGAAEDYLAVYQETTYSSSPKGSGYTTARYGGIAGWQHTTGAAGARRSRLDYFAYGSLTPVGSIPQSGVVKYTLLSSGNYATATDLWFLPSGSSNFLTVDFGAKTVSGSLGLGGQNFYKNVEGGVGSFPIIGTFAGNSFEGSFTDGSFDTSGAVPGQYRLYFVGPNANEVILTFSFDDGRQAGVGAAIGVVDPFVY